MELEILRKAREEEGKRSAETRKELSKTSAKLKETTDLLQGVRTTNSELTEECKQLKEATIVQWEIEKRLQEGTVKLQTDLNAVRLDLKATWEKIVELNSSMVAEHEEGFYKALRQA